MVEIKESSVQEPKKRIQTGLRKIVINGGKCSAVADFHGVDTVFMLETDVSLLTEVRGVKNLFLIKVTGLKEVLDFRALDSVCVRESNLSDVRKIICCTNTKLSGVRDSKTWKGWLYYVSMQDKNTFCEPVYDLLGKNNHNKR